MEVIIDGIKYVPEKPIPDEMSIWYMHDNHMFSRLYGITLDEILDNADLIENKSSYGMLCSVILQCKSKEVRRVGECVHSHGKDKKSWEEGKITWRKAMEEDPDVMRLLGTNIK